MIPKSGNRFSGKIMRMIMRKIMRKQDHA